MKIWYQSFANFDRLSAYGKAITKYLHGFDGRGIHFEVHGLKFGGLADQYRAFECFDTAEVLRNVRLANDRKFDAVAIGNILDPGLREAREISEIPVMGLCESSLMIASLMGRNVSLVTVNERFIPRIEENVRRYGLWEKVRGIHTMAVEVEELDSAYRDKRIRQRVIDKFLEGARPLVQGGAEVIIPAGGVAMLLLAMAKVHSIDNVPIVNGIIALTSIVEMMIGFRAKTGVFISRRLSYAPPGVSVWKNAQNVYGLK
jgi:allantoin racemase